MKPETRTVNELFQLDVRYVVPLYQRPYVWNEEDQWEPLWGDLQVLLNHQMNGGPSPAYTHFLGAIVLEQRTQAPGKIPQFLVIDGQQRLTTLQLVLAAAQKVAAKRGNADEAELLGELITNNRRKADGIERLKVWPTNINRAAFQSVLLPELDEPLANDPKNLIHEAFAFFEKRIETWVDDVEAEGGHGALTTLRVTLSDLVKIVSITLEADDNAQVIFETLNDRGTDLLALDLVKNSAFQEAAKQGADVDTLYDEVWRPQLDQERWRDEKRQGRLNRAQGELFLMHWLGMKLRHVIPATELFTTFRRSILNTVPPPDMADLIRELNRDAATYRSFGHQPEGTAEAMFFERLEALDVTTLMPLVLMLYTSSELEIARRRRALGIIESWLVRRMLVGLTTKNYNSEVAQLLSKVGEGRDHADDVINEHLSRATADTNRWPSDDELTGVLESAPLYDRLTQPRVAMVLKAVELSLYDKRMDVPHVQKRLSIEHVMPQKWEKHWALPAEVDPLVREELNIERNARIHRIGNLTLTTLPLNQALSNAAWGTKRGELNKGSKLQLNTELLDNHPAVFDEAAIDHRTVVLARRICAIWPGPKSASN